MTNEEKFFGLGAGRLYIAPADVPEERARTLAYYAGPTKDGVNISYSAKIHEITDYDGRLIRSLRYGERITVKGRLARLHPQVLSAATGSPYAGQILALGARGDAGRLSRVRVTLVCALPDEAGGGEASFSMICSASSGASFTLSPQRDSGVSFLLCAETDDAGLTGKLVFV